MSDEDENTGEFSDEAESFLSTLTPGEAEVLRERFNIEMTSGKSPKNDLEQLKRLQKRIREIEEKAQQRKEQSGTDE